MLYGIVFLTFWWSPRFAGFDALCLRGRARAFQAFQAVLFTPLFTLFTHEIACILFFAFFLVSQCTTPTALRSEAVGQEVAAPKYSLSTEPSTQSHSSWRRPSLQH